MNILKNLLEENPHLETVLRYEESENILYLRKVIASEDLRKLERIAQGNFFIQKALI